MGSGKDSARPWLLNALLALVLASAGTSGCHKAPSGPPKAVTLRVTGMTCTSCTQAISAALKKLPGVKEVAVSLESKEATIRYIGGGAGVADFVAAITKLGYKAEAPGQPGAP